MLGVSSKRVLRFFKNEEIENVEPVLKWKILDF